MKHILLILATVFIMQQGFAQSVKDANVYPSNIDANMWYESYDSRSMTIKNLNFMVLSDGNNSKDRTGPFVVKLYLYNKEKYEADKTIYYVKTYDLEGIYHMGAHEWKNENISLKGFDVPAGVWRLGIQVDADDQIQEDNNDNALLFQGEIVIREGQENSTPDNVEKQKDSEPSDPDAQLKEEKATAEEELTWLTKQITTKEFELNENRKKGITPYDQKIAELEIEELKLKREQKKISIGRMDQTLSKKITLDQQQTYIAKEQELELKAGSLQKQRNEMISIKTQNSQYTYQVKEYNNQILIAESQLTSMQRINKLDSINYEIRRNEIEELKFKQLAASAGKERTDKIIAGTASEEEINKLQLTEDDYSTRVKEKNAEISKLMRDRREEEKAMRKSQNKEKIDNTKLKAKVKLLTSDIKSMERSLAKEKEKKKQNAEKISKIEKELKEKKTQLAEYELQLKQ